jgi:hypothetical protein
MWGADYVKVVGYTYACDIYCPDCLIEYMIERGAASPAARNMDIDEVLNQIFEANAVDRNDVYSFDSEDYPKDILSYQAHSSCTIDDGCSDRCGRCGEPLDGVLCYGFSVEYEMGDDDDGE